LLFEPRQIAKLLLELALLTAAPPRHDHADGKHRNCERETGQPASRTSWDGTGLIEERLLPLSVEVVEAAGARILEDRPSGDRECEVGEVPTTTPSELGIPQHRVVHAPGHPEAGIGRNGLGQPCARSNHSVVHDLDGPIEAIAIPPTDLVSERFGIGTIRYPVLGYVEQAVVPRAGHVNGEPVGEDDDALLPEDGRSQDLAFRPSQGLGIERDPILEHTNSYRLVETSQLLDDPIDEHFEVAPVTLENALRHLEPIDPDRAGRGRVSELHVREQLVAATTVDLGCGWCCEEPDEEHRNDGDEKSSAHAEIVPVVDLTVA
jgi:hypothetical protein